MFQVKYKNLNKNLKSITSPFKLKSKIQEWESPKKIQENCF